MVNGILDASRSCLKEEIRMDVISNNLANSNLIGFKKDRISFVDLLNKAEADGSLSAKAAGQDDQSLISITTDMSQGDTRFTGNQLDLAIYGDGFFKVSTPDGTRYTRKGNFMLDEQGTLVTQNGFNVLGKSGTITISGNDISISGQGDIMVDGVSVGQLDLVVFEDPKDLVKEGKSLFRNQFDNPGEAPSSDTTVKQGYLEISNVNVAEEMVQMIHSLRAFESYQKAIQVLDGMNKKVVNEVGRLR